MHAVCVSTEAICRISRVASCGRCRYDTCIAERLALGRCRFDLHGRGELECCVDWVMSRRIEEFAMDKVRILLVLSLMCAVSACDEGESNDRHGSNDVNGSFDCDYPEVMCDNICVDLDKRHWVDCNECADGYVGRYGDPRNGCVASGYDPDPDPGPGPGPGPEPYECVGTDERICGDECVSLSKMNWKDCNECADGYVSKDNDVVDACVCRTGEDCPGIGCVVLDEKNWSRCGMCKDGFADLDEDEANGCEARDCQFYGEERCEDNACYDFNAMNWSRCGECKKGYVKESEGAMSRCYNPFGKEHCEESGNTWCSTKCVNLADYNWSACHTCIDSSFEHKYGDKNEACVCPEGLSACDQKCIDFNEKGWKECGLCADGATPKNKDPKNGCECPSGKESCNGACVNYKEMNWQACGECAAGYDFAEDDETNTQACVCRVDKGAKYCSELEMCVYFGDMHWKACGECADTYVPQDNDKTKACTCDGRLQCVVGGKQQCMPETKNWKKCFECKEGYFKAKDDKTGDCVAPNCAAGLMAIGYDNKQGYVCATPIGSADEFIKLRDDWNGNKIPNKDKQIYYLTGDIYLGDNVAELSRWEGFKYFSAEMLSDGKKITTKAKKGASQKLKCKDNSKSCGIFNTVNKANIHHIDIDVEMEYNATTGDVGCLIGMLFDMGANGVAGVVSDMNVTCKITSKSSGGAGGIIGKSNGTGDVGISNVKMNATIEAEQGNVGGLVGSVASSDSTLTIENPTIVGAKLTGKVVGGAIGLYTNSHTHQISMIAPTVDSTLTIDGKLHAGGLIGEIKTSDANNAKFTVEINKLQSSAKIVSSSTQEYHLGGIIGYIDVDSKFTNRVVVLNTTLLNTFDGKNNGSKNENNMGSIIGKAQSSIKTGKQNAEISVYNTISHSVFPMTQGIVESPMIASIKDVNTSIENAVFADELASPVNPVNPNMTYKSVFFYKEIVTSFGDAIGTDDKPSEITYRAFTFADNGATVIEWTNDKIISVEELIRNNVNRHNKAQTEVDRKWLVWKSQSRKVWGNYYKLPMVNYKVSSW